MARGVPGSTARRSPRAARPIINALAAGYAALTLVSIVYFVTAPMVNLALITVALAAAAMKSRAEQAVESR